MTRLTHLTTRKLCDIKNCGAEHLPVPREELLAQLDRQWVWFQSEYWITRDGVKINLVDMSSSHIDNTVAMLERALAHTAVRFRLMFSYPSYDGHGDMAQLHIDSDRDELYRAIAANPEGVPIYAALLAEQQRRHQRTAESARRHPSATNTW